MNTTESNNERSEYVPLSVREGNWFRKLRWWVLGQREALAFRLAPWMRASIEAYSAQMVAGDADYWRGKSIALEGALKRAQHRRVSSEEMDGELVGRLEEIV